MRLKKQHIVYALIIGTLFSCVPARKYEELKARQDACKDEVEALKTHNQKLEEENKELSSSLEELKKKKAVLEEDLAILEKSHKQMKTNYDNINDTYQLLLDKNKELLAGNKSATAKLMTQLQKTQEENANPHQEALASTIGFKFKKKATQDAPANSNTRNQAQTWRCLKLGCAFGQCKITI